MSSMVPRFCVSPRARGLATAGAALALTLVGSHASAQTAEDERMAMRRIAMDRAQQESNEGRHEQALEFAQRAGAIQMSASLRLFIASEHRALGHHADSLRAALLCSREALQAASRREEIRAACEELVRQEQRLVGSLLLRVPNAPAAGLRVSIDGREVDAAILGLPYPIDQGQHRLRLEAPSFAVAERTFSIDYGATHTVSIELSTTPTSGSADVPPIAPPRERPASAGPGAGPWVLVGVGGALLIASAGFFAGYLVNTQGCEITSTGEGLCDNETQRMHAEAWATPTAIGAHVSLYAGIAAVGGGLLWWALSPRGSSAASSERASVTPWVAPGEGGAVLAGLRVRH